MDANRSNGRLRGRAAALGGVMIFAVCSLLSGCRLYEDALEKTRRAQELRIVAELDVLAAAVEKYKDEKGLYPPSRLEEAEAHLRRAFPRSEEKPAQFTDPAQALVFWLSRTSADPRHPFTGAEKIVYVDFDPQRLDSPSLIYRPPGAELTQPYVYTLNDDSFEIRSAGLDDKLNTADDLYVTGN